MKRKIHEIKKNDIVKKKKEEEVTGVLTAAQREKRKTSLYRPPTSEELNELRENENLYKNNLFRMQIQYLLEEVCLEEKKTKKINHVLHSLNTYLTSISSSDKQYNLSEVDLPEGIKLPLPDTIGCSKIKGNFKFIAPTDVKVIGSYLLQTITKPNGCIDVAVEIPKDCFHGRDYLNYRYHFKRVYYLSCIAGALKKWEHTKKLQFTSDTNAYKPCLLIQLNGKLGKKHCIKLHLSIPECLYKFSRFSPLKNNVRSNWFDDIEEEIGEEIEFPTPMYNSSILSDMTYETHLHVLYAALKECPAMKEAICLFKVWLKQRSFKGNCSFNGFIGSMTMVYLLLSKKISSHMSSYQIFRMVLYFLASTDWTTNGISLCNDETCQAKLGDFHGCFDVVFLDPTGYLNLCANVNKLTYEMIKHEAKVSLQILNNTSVDGFDALFIKCQYFLQSSDHAFWLSDLTDCKLNLTNSEEYKQFVVDNGGDWTHLVPKLIGNVLTKGLDNRVYRLIIRPLESRVWDITSAPPSFSDSTFEFGLHLNTEHSDNVLIMGPPADQPEAKEFRSFWGSKSELRRFQDGSINEAVLWPCSNSEEKRMICKKIIEHLLQLHCSIQESSIHYCGNEFNFMLKPKLMTAKEPTKARIKPGCGDEEGVFFLKTFDELCKQVRNLDNLPLKINSIDGIDPACRKTEVITPYQYKPKRESHQKLLYPNLDKKCPSWCPAYNALVKFETSGKWPDDLEAIQHIKAAFHIKIAECIQKQLHITAQPSPTFVDVLKNGYVFRLSVVHYREMVLCRDTTATGVLKKEHETASKSLDLLINKKPLHNTLLHSLSSQHLAYALTVRLCKRWIASQMLSFHLCEEAIELIVASLFLNPAPNKAPCSHSSGFLRFLTCLSGYDWLNEPMIINLNDQITDEECINIRENFLLNRQQLPPMYIVTSYDKDTPIWTKNNPTNPILRRISLLAGAALNVLGDNLKNLSLDTCKQFFRPSLSDYDVVIELEKDFVPLHFQAVDGAASRKAISVKDTRSSSCLPVVDFDPARLFLHELQSAFSEVALFFYDQYGGVKIGVVWKPNTTQIQPFKILQAKYKKIVNDTKTPKKKRKSTLQTTSKDMMVNIPAIISDFDVIGKGIVKRTIQQKKL